MAGAADDERLAPHLGHEGGPRGLARSWPAEAGPAPRAAAGPVGGADQRSPRGIHRLGRLPGQPGQDPAEHPPGGASARHRRGPRRLRPAAGPGYLRDLRPQARRLLRRRAQGHPRLLLHRHRPAGRGPRHPAPARRRRGHRQRGHRHVPGRPRAGGAASLPGSRRAARARPRCSTAQQRRQVEQARYQAARAERRYQAVDPDNRLVARGLETAWEKALTELAAAETELARRQAARPAALTAGERAAILALGDDLQAVWDAPTTTDKDRKQLLRTLLDEVGITVCRDHDSGRADLVLRWKGGAISDLTIPVKRKPPRRLRTDEDTISLVRRLAVHYDDAKIAWILNRQHRRTPRGLSYTAGRVQGLRHYWDIPRHQDTADNQEGELLTVADAAARTRPGTLHLAPLAERRVHRRRAAHSRRPLADPAHPRASAPCSSTTPRTAGSPCWKPPSPTASPARPSCNVSRTAGSAPSTSAPDAGKACVSNPPSPRTGCSDHHNEQREQCDDASKNFRMSRSITQSVSQHRRRQAATASSAERFGRYP